MLRPAIHRRISQPGRPRALQGEIPKISDLPAPWGNQPSPVIPDEDLARVGYLPAKYPQGFSPLHDIAA